MTWLESPRTSAFDLEHLKRATLGNPVLAREVITLFITQALRISGALARRPDDSNALAHTLKGAARAVGAVAVADAAGAVEQIIRDGGELEPALAALDTVVREAREAGNAILNPPGQRGG